MKKSIKLSILLTLLIVSLQSSLNAEDGILVVQTTPLSKLLISANSSVPAAIISLNHATISAEITGRVLEVNSETGNFVNKNELLVSLDCRSYSLAKKQAEAGLRVARTQLSYANKQFKRNKELIKKGIIPRATFEKAESGKLKALADIQLKKASIDSTSLAISRCEISAPFEGQITKRLVQKGQLVTAGTPLFKLMQNENLEVKANLSIDNIEKLSNASALEFVSRDLRLQLKVRSIIQNIDETTRTQEVRLNLPDTTQVSAGLSGRIEWSSKAQLLPAEYIVRRGGVLGVMLAVDIKNNIGKAKFHALTKAQEGQSAIIKLPATTNVITLNRYRVKDNSAIKLQKPFQTLQLKK